ncbi:DUF2059 domain-containing protein [Pedobacter sp.]|uniref:DUF2059 domain-containing protein n=1 Tax=Pedobacter sp. TaxID=1411316 RepID=UPI003D7FCCB2
MKKITLLLALFLLTVSSAYSQQTATTYKETLDKMMEVSGSKPTYKAAIVQIVSSFKAQKPDVPEDVWLDFEKTFIKAATDDLLNLLLPIYQKHIPEADLKNIIAFYETPTGKKFAAKSPLIMQESMQVGQEWGIKIGKDFSERLKEKGF